MAGTAWDEHSYGDNTAVCIEDGNKVLDYIGRDKRLNVDSFKDSLEKPGVTVDKHRINVCSGICEAWLGVAEFHPRTRGTRVLH